MVGLSGVASRRCSTRSSQSPRRPGLPGRPSARPGRAAILSSPAAFAGVPWRRADDPWTHYPDMSRRRWRRVGNLAVPFGGRQRSRSYSTPAQGFTFSEIVAEKE